MNRELGEQIRRYSTLRAIPGVVVEVLQIGEAPATEVAKLVQLVARDPALAAKVLGTANSSLCGAAQAVTSLEEATELLGIRTVKVLVLGFALADSLLKGSPGRLNVNAYWKRSLCSAAAARSLARAKKIKQTDTCFLAAFLMDAGMIALDQVLGGEYESVVAQAPQHRSLCGVEAEALGMTHADAAAILAEHWHLPLAVRGPMAIHHSPKVAQGESSHETANVIWLASRCADILVEPDPVEAIAQVHRECAEHYGIDQAQCDEILAGIGQAATELSSSLFDVKPVSAVVAGPSRAAATEPENNRPDDKRRAPRIARKGSITIVPCTEDGLGVPVRVGFRDLSRNGMGLTHSQPMPVGSQFVVQVSGQGAGAVPIVYTIVRCIAKGPAAFEIGARVAAVHRQSRSGKEGTAA
jgi:HD-like signal output (HDOD) protein